MRHETDGYVSDSKPSVKDDSSTGDNLAEILHSLSLTSETTPTVQASVKSKLTIKREGQVVSREPTLEINTRDFHKPLELSEVAPQLWISQTPNLVRAYHQRGIFSRPEVEDVTTAMKDWGKSNQDDIKKLIALVNRILRVTRNWGGISIIRYPLSRTLKISTSPHFLISLCSRSISSAVLYLICRVLVEILRSHIYIIMLGSRSSRPTLRRRWVIGDTTLDTYKEGLSLVPSSF